MHALFRRPLAALVLCIPLAMPAMAQEGHDHGHGQPERPSTRAYIDAMERMHGAMSGMAYSGDADIDFARGMIPHHQAAIDMARIVLEHGEDAQIRALAEAIIDAQEAEIAELEAWLAIHDTD